MFTLNCNGRLINWEQPVIMGILNNTPDSFHSKSRVNTVEEALQKAGEMLESGAAILDIGGQSTRPGTEQIGAEVEMNRVIPIIEAISKHFKDAIISIDTFYAEVAKEAVASGASIINDVSAGLRDSDMLTTVAQLKTPYICMHHGGDGHNLHQPSQEDNIMKGMIDFFIERIETCKNAGIKDLMIDPGFGFGKTMEQNFQIIKELSALKIFGKPILLGVSRKSSIYKSIGGTAETALNGTTVLHTVGLMNGAQILRVHDIKEARETIQLISLINQ